MSNTRIEIDYEKLGIKDIMSEPKVEADPRFKEAFCKSLGLYWRTWPSEKPETDPNGNNYCLIWPIGENEISYGFVDDYGRWDVEKRYIPTQPGDRWLPLSALEKLP